MVLGGLAQPAPVRRSASNARAVTDLHSALTFTYESAARFNELVIGNIDAIDGSLTAILAGSVAIAAFAIEKIVDAATLAERTAIALVAAAILCCSFGILVGLTGRVSNRDGVRPRALVADLTLGRTETILGAVQDLITASEMNLRVRFYKRSLAACAAGFLVVTVILVALIRLQGGMVH
jgi:hypothetical protein